MSDCKGGRARIDGGRPSQSPVTHRFLYESGSESGTPSLKQRLTTADHHGPGRNRHGRMVEAAGLPEVTQHKATQRMSLAYDAIRKRRRWSWIRSGAAKERGILCNR